MTTLRTIDATISVAPQISLEDLAARPTFEGKILTTDNQPTNRVDMWEIFEGLVGQAGDTKHVMERLNVTLNKFSPCEWDGEHEPICTLPLGPLSPRFLMECVGLGSLSESHDAPHGVLLHE